MAATGEAETRQETVAAGFACALFDHAVARGAEPAELARRAGLERDALADPDARVPLDRYKALMMAGKALTGDPALALHFGEAFDISQLSIVGLMGDATATVADAFAMLPRFTRLVIDVALQEEAHGQRYHLKRIDGELWFIDMRKHPNDFPELTESAFARTMPASRRLGGGSFVKAVHFTHPAPPYRDEYERIFGVPVVFEAAHNALLMTGDGWMGLKSGQPSPYLLAVLKDRAEALLERLNGPATVRGQLEQLLAPILHKGEARMPIAAARLGVSRATLARRLQAEGTNFEAVLAGLRQRLARDYLGTKRLSVAETAYLLGFSEPAAFSRAFRRWTGASPRSFRAARR